MKNTVEHSIGTEANFLSYGPDVIQYLGASYDYGTLKTFIFILMRTFIYVSWDFGAHYQGSVMHYGAYSFGIDPSIPTIITRQPGVEIGQRRGFSEV